MRLPAWTWRPAPARIDANGSLSALSATGLPDGTLFLITLPGIAQ
ncbi:hypothetical protein [Nonomuraea sp. GTA35]